MPPYSLHSKLNLIVLNPYISVRNCTFSGQSLIIHSKQSTYPLHIFTVRIHNSSFINTLKTGKGGAVSISSDFIRSKVFFSECSFFHNAAIRLENDNLGIGGALFVEGVGMQLSITNNQFINNFASDSGMAIYSSQDVSVSIVHSSFHYDINAISDNIREKDGPVPAIVSIAGTAYLFEASFYIPDIDQKPYLQPLNMVFISEGRGLDLKVKCPRWFNHVSKYKFVSVVNSMTDSTYSIIKQAKYECIPCSESHYTVSDSRGQMLFSFRKNLSDQIVSAEKPAVCLPCPYGARCTGSNVEPWANYWGYWHKQQLNFVRCPLKYCCSGKHGETCTSYDYCEGNRTGSLCGVCSKGFTVAILTGACVPDSECGKAHWFWIVAFLGTLFYAMWYTFLGNTFEPFFNLLFIKTCKKLSQGTNKMKRAITVEGPIINILSRSDDSNGNNKDGIDRNNCADKMTHQNTEKNIRGINQNELGAPVSPQTKVYKNKGYFGIFNNFIQMAAAMKIKIEYGNGQNNQSLLDNMTNLVHSFVSVKLSEISSDVCPIVGLTTLGRHIYDLIFTFGIYWSWFLMFMTIICLSSVMKKANLSRFFKLDTLSYTMVGGLIKIIKFTYTKICSISFMSVTCVQIGSDYVWRYDARNICFETWQTVISVFGVFNVLPFPFALFMAMTRLNNNKISAPLFIAVCLFPGPGLISILIWDVFKGGHSKCIGLAPLCNPPIHH